MVKYLHFNELNTALNSLRTIERDHGEYPDSWISYTAENVEAFAKIHNLTEDPTYAKVISALADAWENDDKNAIQVVGPLLRDLDDIVMQSKHDAYSERFDSFKEEAEAKDVSHYSHLLDVATDIVNGDKEEEDGFMIYLLERFTESEIYDAYPLLAMFASCRNWTSMIIKRKEIFRDIIDEGIEKGCFSLESDSMRIFLILIQDNKCDVFHKKQLEDLINIYLPEAEKGVKEAKEAMNSLADWYRGVLVDKKKEYSPFSITPRCIYDTLFDKYLESISNDELKNIVKILKENYPEKDAYPCEQQYKEVINMIDSYAEKNGLTGEKPYIEIIDAFCSEYEGRWHPLEEDFKRDRLIDRSLGKLSKLKELDEIGVKPVIEEEISDEIKAKAQEILGSNNYLNVTYWTYRDNEPKSSSSERFCLTDLSEGRILDMDYIKAEVVKASCDAIVLKIKDKEYNTPLNRGEWSFEGGRDGDYEHFLSIRYENDSTYDKLKSLMGWTITEIDHLVKRDGMDTYLEKIEYFLLVMKAVTDMENSRYGKIQRRLLSIRYHLLNGEIPNSYNVQL